MKKPTSYKPVCPNHNVELVDLPFPLPSKGEGTCPISSCRFDYEIEMDESVMTRDKDGNMVKGKKFKVEGEEH